jgi:hypothetical protein
MADTNVLQNAIDFYQKIKSEEEVTVKFRKINGAVRIMRCTLDFDKIPNNKIPKDVNMAKIFSLVQKHGMVHVFDLDKKDWRTVPFKTSEWVETKDNIRFRVKK